MKLIFHISSLHYGFLIPICRSRTGEAEGGRYLLPFFLKIEKIALILEKGNLIVFIYELNFSFRMLFYQYLGEKNSKRFFVGSLFYVW